LNAEGECITVEEAGRRCGVSRPTAYVACHQWLQTAGEAGIPCRRVGRRIVVPLRAFNRWLEGQREELT